MVIAAELERARADPGRERVRLSVCPSVRLSVCLRDSRSLRPAPGAGADAMEGEQPAVSAEELTTPSLKKAQTPPLHEDANTAVIAVVITLVFLTLLTVLVVIVTYLYRNKGTYLTFQFPGVVGL
ncbi:small cell adhesion glycoprotein-like [Patagioenas fasciata monilis]|uniref:Small cell adhesion glycoprotein-like n=1 Tax=Patagioenas fasciata monilis TaxID=372326 RepID=A0A1V4JT87_PATFA|nr:small cell adhesion glycoprotein-like [Patagioenas fasciata monilis]